VSIQRGIDDAEPVRPQPIESLDGLHEERRSAERTRLGSGTLACPACDAPVLPAQASLAPSASISCPVCFTPGAVRDFLTLGEPTRPTRVSVYVVQREPRRPAVRRR
jgi:hypothetical protein